MKVGFLVSYDYRFLPTAINAIYPIATKIFLAIDINQKTWTGQSFEIKDSFFKDIEIIDFQKKIIWIKKEFYLPNLTSMDCETRERNILLKEMGKGWKMQLDSDEYLINVDELKKFYKMFSWLGYLGNWIPVNIQCNAIVLFREIENRGYLYVKEEETVNIITNTNTYHKARLNYSTKSLQLPLFMLHHSWARSECEIKEKIASWGHVNDFNTQEFFDKWSSINENNFFQMKNFHPIKPEVWKSLGFINETNISLLIKNFNQRLNKNIINNWQLGIFNWVKFVIIQLPLIKVKFKIKKLIAFFNQDR